jgi:hypothetical protein
MDCIKRINLSFDLRREKDRQVYNILVQVQHKTAFIVETVLYYEKDNQSKFDKNTVKQALQEVLSEMNITIDKNKQDGEDEIPDEIFDLFEKL